MAKQQTNEILRAQTGPAIPKVRETRGSLLQGMHPDLSRPSETFAVMDVVQAFLLDRHGNLYSILAGADHRRAISFVDEDLGRRG